MGLNLGPLCSPLCGETGPDVGIEYGDSGDSPPELATLGLLPIVGLWAAMYRHFHLGSLLPQMKGLSEDSVQTVRHGPVQSKLTIRMAKVDHISLC